MSTENERAHPHVKAATSREQEDYTAAGEDQGQSRTFSADQVARAFGIEVGRVHNAFEGEFKLDAEATVDSRQAQQLAEVILGDQPLDHQQAALMKLGAYTPRTDAVEATATEKRPGEQSDRIRPSEEVSEIGAPRKDGD